MEQAAAQMATMAPGPAVGTERDREQAFAALVASHRDRALGLAWRLVGGDAAAAEDVVQDAFVRAWRALPRFRGDAQMGTWLYRIVVRQAANHRRWRAVRDRFARERAADPPAWGTPSTGDPVLRRRVAEALDALPRLQREAFVLVALEGFTAGEAAGMMGRAEGTVKSHLHRARTALRGRLADLADATAEGDA